MVYESSLKQFTLCHLHQLDDCMGTTFALRLNRFTQLFIQCQIICEKKCANNIISLHETPITCMCMLNHCLEWHKWVLTNFDHDRQRFNTLIPTSHESAAVTDDCISRLSGPVKLIVRYTTADIHCRDKWGVMSGITCNNNVNWISKNRLVYLESKLQCEK